MGLNFQTKAFIAVVHFLVLASLNSSASFQNKNENQIQKNVGTTGINIMTYNVENLFDTKHDEGKEDWAYLPKSHPGKEEGCRAGSASYLEDCLNTDWTQEKLDMKINNIKQIALSKGRPDVIVFQEIENLNVLQMLATALGYERAILVEGPDARGIDVGVVYSETSLNYISHSSRPMSGPEFQSKPTRDLLSVYFYVNGKKDTMLGVYANHWPSQAATTPKRLATAKLVRQYVEEDMKKFGDKFHAVVAGDFNTTLTDYPSPYEVLKQNRLLLDTRELADVKGNPNFKKLPPGSYFFPPKMAWDVIDRIFVSANLNDELGLDVVVNSYSIIAGPGATTTYEYTNQNDYLFGSKVTNVPKKFNPTATTPEEMAATDHFPVAITIKYNYLPE